MHDGMKEPLLVILCWIITVAVVVHAQHRFDCDPNYCSKKENQCSELNCQNGRIVPNATLCGCCDICVESLEEDAACSNTEFGWSSNLKECGHGLFCNQTGKCEATKCLKQVRKYNEENASHALNVSFTCNYFGNYDPVACIADIVCFCVDKEGKRIFGTDFASNKDLMTCDCSRDIRSFPKEVEDEAYLPRCLPNGNYDPLQCTKDKCFCMDSSNRNDVPNDDSSMGSLPCYDIIRHENGRKTKCLKKKEEQKKLFKNYTVIGIEPIRCDLDGSYFPVQCDPGRCYCVTKNGIMYDKYVVEKRKADGMTCRCLRDKEILGNIKDLNNLQQFQDLECNELGNYKSESKGSITENFFQDFA